MNSKFVKYSLSMLFFIALVFMNMEDMPRPVEPSSYDFLTSGGIDIDIKKQDNAERCSITYLDNADSNNTKSPFDSSEVDTAKDVINAKAYSINGVFEKLHNITKKSLGGSHINKILIGEDTLKYNFDYLVDELARNRRIRLDSNVFVIKNLTSEEFFQKIDTSYDKFTKDLDFIVNNSAGLSYISKKDLGDCMGIFYSDTQIGLLPALEIIKSPKDNEKNEKDEEKEKEKKEDSGYTFGFCGMGIIDNGKLVDYLEYELIRTYTLMTGVVKNSNIEVTDEDGNMSAFNIISSKNKTEFIFDKDDLKKIKMDIILNVGYAETDSKEDEFVYDNFIKLENLQSEKIKKEAEKIIKKSKDLKCDFISLGSTMSMQYPYKWHKIKDNWSTIYPDVDIEINVKTKIIRTFGIRKNVNENKVNQLEIAN